MCVNWQLLGLGLHRGLDEILVANACTRCAANGSVVDVRAQVARKGLMEALLLVSTRAAAPDKHASGRWQRVIL